MIWEALKLTVERRMHGVRNLELHDPKNQVCLPIRHEKTREVIEVNVMGKLFQ